MTPFFEKLGEMAKNKYDFLRLKEAIVDKDLFTVELNFVIPDDLDEMQWNGEVIAELEAYCKDIVPSHFTTTFRYIKSVLDEDVILKVLNDYIKDTQSALIGQYDKSQIEVLITNKIVKINIPAYDIAIKYCKETEYDKKLVNYLERSFCANFSINFKSLGVANSGKLDAKPEEIYIDKGIIYVTNRVPFFGGGANLNPKYIENYKKPVAEAIVCGRLENFERKISKKSGRIFYTFTLNDSTAEMRCVAFSRSTKKGAFDWLMPTDQYMATFGKEKKIIPVNDADTNPTLVIEGELVEDSFKKGLTLLVRKASCCRIDFDEITAQRTKTFVLNNKTKKAEVMPYAGQGITNLFDMIDDPCDFIKKNNFVVFDLETTGLDTAKAQIIEIGAVRVENGEIVSYYNSLVDPKMPIPPDATKVNNIYDSDVAEWPYIEDVLPDFVEYCKDSIVVAHNGDYYDFKILRRDCYSLNLEFNNRTMDSLTLARQACPDMGRHNLDALCRRFQIDLKNAHRAYFDAEATAKVFIKMCNKMNLK